jgi:hypothetical protein
VLIVTQSPSAATFDPNPAPARRRGGEGVARRTLAIEGNLPFLPSIGVAVEDVLSRPAAEGINAR